jgi:hypothetical protein
VARLQEPRGGAEGQRRPGRAKHRSVGRGHRCRRAGRAGRGHLAAGQSRSSAGDKNATYDLTVTGAGGARGRLISEGSKAEVGCERKLPAATGAWRSGDAGDGESGAGRREYQKSRPIFVI